MSRSASSYRIGLLGASPLRKYAGPVPWSRIRCIVRRDTCRYLAAWLTVSFTRGFTADQPMP
ncbi:hypothetical protein HMPREF1315_0504 [Bifidobacterium longum subsp. longum 2-2B]|uniref:Uncharacterized protein n=1 Tax=Bifidobacterium longum subsp. longum 2-2B TaxID=1161745 RepID=A0AAV3FMI6_BIFLL|nr:hypothetical protein HMPREF1315_0504 [Bifidobacterium longum subsp. longum 2-2B]